MLVDPRRRVDRGRHRRRGAPPPDRRRGRAGRPGDGVGVRRRQHAGRPHSAASPCSPSTRGRRRPSTPDQSTRRDPARNASSRRHALRGAWRRLDVLQAGSSDGSARVALLGGQRPGDLGTRLADVALRLLGRRAVREPLVEPAESGRATRAAWGSRTRGSTEALWKPSVSTSVSDAAEELLEVGLEHVLLAEAEDRERDLARRLVGRRPGRGARPTRRPWPPRSAARRGPRRPAPCPRWSCRRSSSASISASPKRPCLASAVISAQRMSWSTASPSTSNDPSSRPMRSSSAASLWAAPA